MRYQFGQGRYGSPPGGAGFTYDVITSLGGMPTALSDVGLLGLADSWFTAPPGGGLVYNVAPCAWPFALLVCSFPSLF